MQKSYIPMNKKNTKYKSQHFSTKFTQGRPLKDYVFRRAKKETVSEKYDARAASKVTILILF